MSDAPLPPRRLPQGAREADAADCCPVCGRYPPADTRRARMPLRVLAAALRGDRTPLRLAEAVDLAAMGALSALPFAVAIALAAAGRWLGCLLLLAGGGIWLVLLLAIVSLEAGAPLASALPLAPALARGRVRLAYVACAAWSHTARELLRARRRQQRLHAARRAEVASLGEAVVRGDYERAASLKSATRALAREMQAREDDVAAAVRGARQRIARARVERRRSLNRPTRGLRA